MILYNDYISIQQVPAIKVLVGHFLSTAAVPWLIDYEVLVLSRQFFFCNRNINKLVLIVSCAKRGFRLHWHVRFQTLMWLPTSFYCELFPQFLMWLPTRFYCELFPQFLVRSGSRDQGGGCWLLTCMDPIKEPPCWFADPSHKLGLKLFGLVVTPRWLKETCSLKTLQWQLGGIRGCKRNWEALINFHAVGGGVGALRVHLLYTVATICANTTTHHFLPAVSEYRKRHSRIFLTFPPHSPPVTPPPKGPIWEKFDKEVIKPAVREGAERSMDDYVSLWTCSE